jgi:hypothetical protein
MNNNGSRECDVDAIINTRYTRLDSPLDLRFPNFYSIRPPFKIVHERNTPLNQNKFK